MQLDRGQTGNQTTTDQAILGIVGPAADCDSTGGGQVHEMTDPTFEKVLLVTVPSAVMAAMHTTMMWQVESTSQMLPMWWHNLAQARRPWR